MKKNLCKRGYTKRSIDNELKKVDKLDRNNWLQNRTDKSKTDGVSFVCVNLSIIVKVSKYSNFSVEYRKSTWMRGCIEFWQTFWN
jgi:hypothetical protein